MASRYEDGIGVLGIDNKSIVDDIERRFQDQKISRSDVLELITKSVEQSKVTKSFDDLLGDLAKFKQQELVLLLKHMTENGSIEEDELSTEITTMLGSLEGLMSDIANVPGNENYVKPGGVEKTSTEDIILTPQSENPMSKTTNKNETTTTESNNGSSEVSTQNSNDVNSKLQATLDAVLEAVKGLQTPAKSVNDETVSETVDSNVSNSESAWKSIFDEVDGLIKESVSKSGEERRNAFQGVVQVFGDKIQAFYNSLEHSVSGEQASNVDVSGLKSEIISEVTKSIAERDAVINRQLTDLTNAVNVMIVNSQKPVAPKTVLPAVAPIQKSITRAAPVRPVAPNTPSKGMSIADIARATVYNG